MILVDTGVLYAAADEDDGEHLGATDWFERTTDELLVRTPVVVETAWMIERRLRTEYEVRFLRSVRSNEVSRVDLTDDDWARVEELVDEYADLELGTVDASASPWPSASASPRSRHSTIATSAWCARATSKRSTSYRATSSRCSRYGDDRLDGSVRKSGRSSPTLAAPATRQRMCQPCLRILDPSDAPPAVNGGSTTRSP